MAIDFKEIGKGAAAGLVFFVTSKLVDEMTKMPKKIALSRSLKQKQKDQEAEELENEEQ